MRSIALSKQDRFLQSLQDLAKHDLETLGQAEPGYSADYFSYGDFAEQLRGAQSGVSRVVALDR